MPLSTAGFASSLNCGWCRVLGTKCYESWQQYLENVRICDDVDFAAISGWESTAIENHSGIVDNLRNFKGDPELIAKCLLPIRPVLKQHALCYGMGECAVFDVYLLNESDAMPGNKLRLEMVGPDRKQVELGSWALPAPVKDQFTYTVQTNFKSPTFEKEGVYRFLLRCEGDPGTGCLREIWVADMKPKLPRLLRIGMSGVLPSLKEQLANLPGIEAAPFDPAEKFDVIVASGIVPQSNPSASAAEETGLEAPPSKVLSNELASPGNLAEGVLAAVHNGTPLLAAVPDDALADGVAKQLAELNAFVYQGQVGDTRAPWMGNWMFVRAHETFDGLPANRTLGIHYQADGKAANGLLIERAEGGSEPEVIMGYSRDHDRNIGAASFVCRVGRIPVLVHRSPAFCAPLQARWLANVLLYLSSGQS
jgi:beta-galactosidase